MKEKLDKNHYKGFDRRAKAVSFCALGLFVLALGTFLPLTALAQSEVYKIQTQENEEKTQNKTDTPKGKASFGLVYSD